MNKRKNKGIFRLRLTEDTRDRHLLSVIFTKTEFFVAMVSFIVMLSAIVFSIIAFTPIRTFIPGYPDARTKRAAIQNAIRMDSLETVIYRWELYAENLRRIVDGQEAVRIDELVMQRQNEGRDAADAGYLKSRDSIMRETVKKEEMFDISGKKQRELPIEGMIFFTPLKGGSVPGI